MQGARCVPLALVHAQRSQAQRRRAALWAAREKGDARGEAAKVCAPAAKSAMPMPPLTAGGGVASSLIMAATSSDGISVAWAR